MQALKRVHLPYGAQTRVASCGYADDVIVFAESEEALTGMHQWTREFFGAHGFRLNAKKTKFSSVKPRPELAKTLLSTDGRSCLGLLSGIWVSCST